MSESIRSFLAFDIENHEVKKKLSDVQASLFRTGADLKLVETENIHITIRFLGNITLSMAEKIFESIKRIQFAAFNIHIKGLGVFPDLHYPRVIWVGIIEGANELKDIFYQLEPKLRSLGFPPDSKGFSAHLTVARVRSGKNKAQLARFITENKDYDIGIVKAECLRLKKSELSSKGPTYSTIKEYCANK